MAFNYSVNIDINACMERLGINERGKVHQTVANSVLELSEPYVPLDEGYLKDSGHIENDTEIVWNGPYANYMYGGIVYEDPDLHCAGFPTDNGWFSRRGVEKVPTDRKLQYGNGNLRGAQWVDRMLQDGGRKKIEDAAREVVGK